MNTRARVTFGFALSTFLACCSTSHGPPGSGTVAIAIEAGESCGVGAYASNTCLVLSAGEAQLVDVRIEGGLVSRAWPAQTVGPTPLRLCYCECTCSPGASLGEVVVVLGDGSEVRRALGEAGSWCCESGPPILDAGGVPRECGARLGDTCAPGEYCDFRDNQCGAADGTGVCRPRPGGCPGIDEPTCGCDGTVHPSACGAAADRTDVNELAGCTAPADTFSCGYRFCAIAQYCMRIFDDTGEPTAYECRSFPAACGGGRDCACVATEPCGEMCEADAGGHVTVTCPGG